MLAHALASRCTPVANCIRAASLSPRRKPQPKARTLLLTIAAIETSAGARADSGSAPGREAGSGGRSNTPREDGPGSGTGTRRSQGKMAPPAPPKLKLLCLHGYLQNAEVFRSRIGSLRKGLKSRVEFVFVDGPFEAQGLPGDEDEVGGGAGGRSWWQWTDSGPAGRPSKAASYTGWDVARTALVAALREHQPDGLLGFSQGATAAALLLADVAGEGGDSGGREAAARLKCAILVAPFLPRDPTVAARVEAGGRAVTTPLLFVGGTADALVPPERTAALSACFPPSLVSTFTHGGAHLVPTCSGDFKAALVAFLDAAASASGAPPAPIHRVASSTSVSLSASQSAASLASADEAQAQTQAQGQAQGAGQGETQGQAGRQEQGQGGGQAQAVEAATAELERVQVAA